MLSVKAIYEDGKITLEQPLNINGDSEVVITFLDERLDISSQEDDCTQQDQQDPKDIAGKYHLKAMPVLSEKEEQSEEYYKRIRRYKRYKAHGNLILVHDGTETTYSLYDYSAGGLSFICDRPFDVDEEITAKIKYSASDEVLELHFDIIIKRIIIDGPKFRIGCQFSDQVDEELWHMVMS